MSDSHTSWKGLVSGLLLVLTLILAPTGCANKSLIPLSAGRLPLFSDDLNNRELRLVLKQSLEYLQKRPPTTRFRFNDRDVTAQRSIDSILFFQDLLNARLSPGAFNKAIQHYFDVFQAGGTSGYNPSRRVLVTGYYQPLFEGSLTRQPPYLHPLYQVPDTLVVRHDGNTGKKSIGRLHNDRFLPYWTRGEIETQGLCSGQELVWLKSPFDAFTLHIQGSGLIRLRDGSIRGVHYAMKNGRQYRSIGKYMVETGRMQLDQASMAAIDSYLSRNPGERDEILHHNESFIFFHWTRTHGALGNLDKELTPGRSIAADQQIFPPGSLAFLTSRRPQVRNGHVVNWVNLHRFVSVQDTGSAIRGPGRVDLFWGAGEEAGMAAGRMKEDGALYLLLLKETAPRRFH